MQTGIGPENTVDVPVVSLDHEELCQFLQDLGGWQQPDVSLHAPSLCSMLVWKCLMSSMNPG